MSNFQWAKSLLVASIVFLNSLGAFAGYVCSGPMIGDNPRDNATVEIEFSKTAVSHSVLEKDQNEYAVLINVIQTNRNGKVILSGRAAGVGVINEGKFSSANRIYVTNIERGGVGSGGMAFEKKDKSTDVLSVALELGDASLSSSTLKCKNF